MKNLISTIAVLGVAVGSLTGCATTPQSTSTTPETERLSPTLVVASTPKTKSEDSPSKVSLTIDLTGSGKENLATTTIEQVEPLIEHIGESGGEIAVQTICSKSNQPAVRANIDPPPAVLQVTASKPTPPPTEGVNSFSLKEKQEEYQTKLTQFLQEQQKVFKALGQWKTERDRKLQVFRSQIKPLLAKPANCQRSDIWLAVRRADLFLSEDTSSWQKKPRLFAVFVTDGLHNTATPSAQIQANVQVILVNGSGEKGVFKTIKHKAFESFPAAVRYLVTANQ